MVVSTSQPAGPPVPSRAHSLSKVVGESSISAAPVGFASSLLFVHGVDKRVKAA